MDDDTEANVDEDDYAEDADIDEPVQYNGVEEPDYFSEEVDMMAEDYDLPLPRSVSPPPPEELTPDPVPAAVPDLTFPVGRPKGPYQSDSDSDGGSSGSDIVFPSISLSVSLAL